MTAKDMQKLGKWFQVANCDEVGCRRKVTHVIFLNQPDDAGYIVGSCPVHKIEGDFKYMTLGKFSKLLTILMERGVTASDLPFVVAREIDPDFKDIRLREPAMPIVVSPATMNS